MKSLALHPSSRLIDRVQIAAPCPAKWDDMVGDERTRFCGQCAKNVYEVSAMTSDEVAELISATEGRACLRLYRRKDGTVITSDCPVGLAERAYKRARTIVLATVALLVTISTGLLGALVTTTCALGDDDPQMLQGKMAPIEDIPEEMEPLMGDVILVEPEAVPAPEAQPLMGRIALPDRDR